ncbi:MAG: esterase-like activity of phytase family protein [Rhodospirillales bacterium]|nr:esterase-like activity of phytase family protein [Rhodospirillales bacterium]
MNGGRSPARALVALVIVGALAVACGDAFAASISLSTRPVALDPTDRAVQHVGRLHYLGGLDLRSAEPAFGGLSGLSVTGGGRLTAVTDRGHWFSARVVRDRTGRLTDLADAALGPLLDTKGHPVAGEWRDAEALERLPGGDWLVSFEGRHRVWRYAAETGGLQGRPAPFPTPKGIAAAPPNGGLEALTPLPDGRILMLAESLKRTGGSRAGWLVGDGTVDAFGYRTARDFKPTDAAVLPNGDVLVLSRYFKLLGGFKARLERISAGANGGGAVPKGELLARFAPPLTVDNYEGVAVARDADGATLVYILSDDNFHFLQRTLLLLFRLDQS